MSSAPDDRPVPDRRVLGRSGLEVTSLCLGTSSFGPDLPAERAVETVRRVLDSPIRFVDTSNQYGDGLSEQRVGAALAAAGGVPDDVLVATKVDPAVGSDDFSGERVRASVRESLERLGLDRLPLCYLHDPERITFEEATAPGGAVEALLALRDDGVIGSLGVAGGPVDLLRQYVATDLFDVVITHNRWTLVDSSADPLLEDAAAAGVAVVNAAPYGGGMLVKGPDVVPTYCYQPAGEDVLERVRRMQQVCDDAGVPLAAAALQFSLHEPRIASTVVGMSSPERVATTLALAAHPVDDAVREELAGLAAPGRAGVGL